jgi:hypothetical protein
MIRSMYLVSGVVLALGCGGGMDDDGGMTTVDAAINEPLVNGKPASAFYAQFTHAVTRAEVSGAAAFATQPDGRNAFITAFFLMPEGKLELFYAEGEGEVTPTGHSLAIFNDTKKHREGTWRVDGAQLVLDAFMRCDGFTFNDSDALRCTLTSTIVTPAAQGSAGTFRKAFGESSPDDSEFADYVP